MSKVAEELTHEFHWLVDMLQTIDVGLCVFDRQFRVKVWNSFMENHSCISPQDIKGKDLFDVFKNLPQAWMKQKTDSVFLLGTRAFTTWEQKPYLFQFKNYRPITGLAPYMYQNVTFSPLTSPSGEVDHVCLIIYDVTDIATHKRALQTANQELQSLSRTDRLTQLYNRGYWEELLHLEFNRYQRYQGDSSVVMFDIDHFKNVNDTYGHQAGDDAIRAVATTLRKHVRTSDIPGRYGGEEFSVILPHTNVAGALVFCERLRAAVEALVVHYRDIDIKFTISLGACQLADQFTNHTQWLEAADKALYQSKESGRNQTSSFATEQTSD